MIVEERIYTLNVGTAPEYLKLYEQEGMAIQRPILGRLVGYFSTDVGPLNEVVHLWAYEDYADRSRRRAQLLAEPGWRAYVAKIRPFVQTQQSKILIPAAFSPTPVEVTS
jgi:hypothetical protein